ncbi:MAG: phosphoribosyltransferase family protein [Bacteroidota bacterium]|jgi:pyrimidine operon attenuation protein/uracil phosphoribosyltransferase
MTTAKHTQILTDQQIKRIVQRLAYQVYEQHVDAKELIIAGVKGNGTHVAKAVCEQLVAISQVKITYTEVLINKQQPDEQEIKLKPEPVYGKGKSSVIVVDDVLNSGRTLMFALLPFVKMGCTSIQTLVLVDRNHRSFPVSADFIGMTLATTMQEHVEVKIEKGKFSAWLS